MDLATSQEFIRALMVIPAVTTATALFIQASLGFMAATMSVAFTDIADFVTKIARMDCAESLRGSLRSFETPEFPPHSCWNKSHAKSVEIVQWDSFCEGERPDAVGALPRNPQKHPRELCLHHSRHALGSDRIWN